MTKDRMRANGSGAPVRAMGYLVPNEGRFRSEIKWSGPLEENTMKQAKVPVE